MRVLVAARLSRTDGGPSRIDRDDDAATKWAAENGHEIVGTAADAGVSGSVSPFARKGLGPWLDVNGSKIHDFDLVVASSLDRLGRNVRQLEELRAWATDNQKQLVVLKPLPMVYPFEKLDIGSSLVWTILEQLAQWELETITSRQEEARKTVRKNRAYVGKPPFGFEVTGVKYNRTIQPIPALASTLRELIRRALRGDTLLALANWMDTQVECPHKQETRSATGWTPTGIRGWLKNPALKGEQQPKNRDGTVLHRHQGLISAEEWTQLQSAMDRGERAVNGRIRNNEHTAFLTGVIFCEKCGGRMFRNISSNKRKGGSINRNEYYRCRGAENSPSKCGNMIRCDLVDGLTQMSFSIVSDEEGTVTGVFANLPVYERITVEGDDHSAEIAECEDQLRALDYDDPDFTAAQAALLSERRKLQGLPIEATKVVEVPTGRTVAEVWASLDYEGQRRYLLASGLRVLVADRNTARMEGDPSKITAALRNIAA